MMKKIFAIIFLMIFGSAVFSAIRYYNQDFKTDMEWGWSPLGKAQGDNHLLFAIQPAKTIFRRDEPIEIKLEIINTGDTPVTLIDPMAACLDVVAFEAEIRTPFFLSLACKKITAECVDPCQYERHYVEGHGYEDVLLTLNPWQRHVINVGFYNDDDGPYQGSPRSWAIESREGGQLIFQDMLARKIFKYPGAYRIRFRYKNNVVRFGVSTAVDVFKNTLLSNEIIIKREF